MDIQIKRIYDSPSEGDGIRILVDRLWPRGISKEKSGIDHWVKDFAPSHELRKWFHQHLEEWDEFSRLYQIELLHQQDHIKAFFADLKSFRITFLYSSKFRDRNHAILLRQFIQNFHYQN